jgi:bifunctional N-acetylglucosamine-1-phosphate-uridyltransferase/glucosamine-1-phosphate-acetyltransferase GlmU-like protein
VKNALLFDEASARHFNYVGDSILGFRAHLGAGAILSNFKSLPGNVTVEFEGVRHDTGLRKFGALVGDEAEVGCNAVLNPGSVIGRGAVIDPGVKWRGVLPANRIAKNARRSKSSNAVPRIVERERFARAALPWIANFFADIVEMAFCPCAAPEGVKVKP